MGQFYFTPGAPHGASIKVTFDCPSNTYSKLSFHTFVCGLFEAGGNLYLCEL